MGNIFSNFGVNTKYGVIPLVIFASVCVGFSLMNQFWKKSKLSHYKRSVSLALLNGGHSALQRLIDYQESRANSQSLAIAECELKKDKKETIDQSMLLCCKLFISESRNHSVLEAIEGAARHNPESVIVYKFGDRAYNRIRYTIVSYVMHDSIGNAIYSPLQQTVVDMAEAAFRAINLELHSGAHPRLGVVDEIVFHPLARASLDEAAWLAKAVAADIGSKFQVPVFLFGAAHPNGKALDTIRRDLGYYRPNYMGNQWAGWTISEILPEKPDEGPSLVSRERGITMIGARTWVTFYNVPILSTDVSAAKRIARKVSARGGGLPTVQALGLFHGEDSTEIACILLEPNQIGPDRVQNRVEMLAAEEGLDVKKGYFTDVSPEMIVDKYMNLVSAKRD